MSSECNFLHNKLRKLSLELAYFEFSFHRSTIIYFEDLGEKLFYDQLAIILQFITSTKIKSYFLICTSNFHNAFGIKSVCVIFSTISSIKHWLFDRYAIKKLPYCMIHTGDRHCGILKKFLKKHMFFFKFQWKIYLID